MYYHDGRGPVRARPGHFLVFWAFDALRKDPRLGGKYPVNERDRKRLSRRQFTEGLKKNRELAARGLPPEMIVTRSVGPAAPHRFFEEGMRGFAQEGNLVILGALNDCFREMIKPFEEELSKGLEISVF